MQCDLERVLFEEPAIHRRFDELAAQISNDYRNHEVTVIAVLTGSLIFMSDLLRRIPLPLKLDYVGFEIEDEFVVGYGFDFMERYRNLPYIGVLRKELLEQPSG